MILIDLTHLLKSSMQVYPGDLKLNIKKSKSVEKDGCQISEIHMNLHTGTHIDCAAHYFKNSESTSNTELEKFYGKAMVINCKSVKKVIDINNLESVKRNILKSDFILFYTGWNEFWGTEQYIVDFPVLSKESVDFLTKLPIKGVGFDTLSADPLFAEEEIIHKALLSSGKIIIENLTNLGSLPEVDFYFSCFPLKIHKGDGSPVRAVAYI